jgi:hypothetical protein
MYQHQLDYRAASEAITSGGYLPALLTELSDYAEATVELFDGAANCVLATFVPRWPGQTAPLMATQTAPGRTG